MWKTDSDLTVGHFRGTSVVAVAVHFEHPKQNAHSSDTFTEIVADGDMCATHAAQMLKKRKGVQQYLLKNDHTLYYLLTGQLLKNSIFSLGNLFSSSFSSHENCRNCPGKTAPKVQKNRNRSLLFFQ